MAAEQLSNHASYVTRACGIVCRYGDLAFLGTDNILAEVLLTAEEERAFLLGVLVAVGAVDGVVALACCEEAADCSFGSLCGVCCADEASEILDSVVFEEDHCDDWAGGHELDELLEERTILMYGIEIGGLVDGQSRGLDGCDGVSSFFNFGENVTDVLVSNSTGLNH